MQLLTPARKSNHSLFRGWTNNYIRENTVDVITYPIKSDIV